MWTASIQYNSAAYKEIDVWYSPRLMDFAVRLVDFTLYLPDGQVKVLGEFFFLVN